MRYIAFFALAFSMVCGVPLAAFSELVHETVVYRDGDAELEGYLVYDSALTKKAPGVLVVHEWWGHNPYARKRAEDYATLGYVAFALDVYGKGRHAETAEQAKQLSAPFYGDRAMFRKRLQAGLAQLSKSPKVDPAKIAALGYCFGGTAVLELARAGASLQGVISFHGGLSTPVSTDMKNFKGKVLVLNGADDPFVPGEERAKFMEEVRNAGIDWQFIEFGGAVHAFSNPGVDAKGLQGAAYNKHADMRSFEMSKDFLREIFS